MMITRLAPMTVLALTPRHASLLASLFAGIATHRFTCTATIFELFIYAAVVAITIMIVGQ